LKAIIFDMDGTLVSSLSLIQHCENEISQKYIGKGLTLEEVISKFGPPARSIIRSITANLGEDVQNRAVRDYYDCYRRNVPSKILVFPGITSLLQRIRKSQRHLALMTGVERNMMEFTLKPFRLDTYFEELVTADDVHNSKPDPEGILLALSRIKAKPSASMYVGDSPADIIAGRRAGVLTGAAMWSPENRGDPSTESPDHQFRSVQQLEDFLFPRKKSDQEPYFGPDGS
jgi:HAD superfamily hydrolase (TIGR01509 family)